jgi:hypothetical protein
LIQLPLNVIEPLLSRERDCWSGRAAAVGPTAAERDLIADLAGVGRRVVGRAARSLAALKKPISHKRLQLSDR